MRPERPVTHPPPASPPGTTGTESRPGLRRWQTGLALALVLGVVWTYLSRVPAAGLAGDARPPSPRAGFPAPDFTLETLDGEGVTLSALRGQPVVINLWASWCAPCRAEMPALQQLYAAHRDEGLVILAVNTTYQDSQAAAAAFVAEFGLTFPVALDRTGAVSRAYLLRGLPTTLFVDAQGTVDSVVIGGPMDMALMESKIDAILEAPR